MSISLRTLVPLCALLAFGAAAAQNPAPAQQGGAVSELIRSARQLNAQGKQDSALVLYRQAMAQAPKSYDAHLGAGTVLDLLGRYDEARDHIGEALHLASPQQKVGALKTLAISYAFEGKCRDAEQYERQAFDAQIAAKEFSPAAETANELARICLESGDVDRAYDWYQRGHATAAMIPSPTDSVRTLWDFRWEHAQARIAARRGKAADARAHVAAAKALLARGLNPDQPRFFPYLTGYVAFYDADYKAAIAELQQADQRDPFILSLLAQAYEKSGDAAKAKELYRQILTFNMHNPTNAFARPLARKKIG